jgi:hypothetical protein
MDEKNGEYHLGGGEYLTMKSSQIVSLREQFVVYSEDGPIYLNAEISADFSTIPSKYHEIFFNILSSKYMNKANFGDNPFSECRPIIKRKWWQFWKSKYFERQ